MGKQGPCHHCGITSTPLWRNGPPEKPILCNACGSRWRTKGTLSNYTPLHARENIDLKDIRLPKIKPNEHKLHKRKQTDCNLQAEHEHEITISDENFHKALEEDTSNRSSSGSAISYSESCSHFGGVDASDPTGSVQCNIWDSLVPSRKRTCMGRPKPSSVEKLTRDLHSILHQQASYISGSPEDELLYETETPWGSVEIGNGGVLIRHPNAAILEDESEASSLPIDNKLATASEAYSGASSLPVNSVGKEDPVDEKVKRTPPAEEHARSSRNNEAKRRKGVRTGPGLLGSSSSVPLRRPNDRLSQNPPEKKSSIKSPKRSSKLRVTNLRSLKSPQPNSMENTLSIFSPRGMLASPLQVNPLLDSLQLDGEDSDQDLLLEVRTNGSFPEAELLSETWKQNAGLNSMSAESGIESISYNPTSSSSSQPLKRWD
ncbi:unnamed protein product [Spirodela intermedia]|uniref:GATA-type domain-containing protein n=1 Tax=Spirodela intermedia TaxID=51605 RepID=A0A7I8IHD4_SPIIN|nr:unnamed protein product [Spirodela intermedia]CAA6657134.1 unnamed protein product [Spirodela intermedia]